MKNIVVLLIAAIILNGCKTKENTITKYDTIYTTNDRLVKEIIKDTVFYSEPDTALIRAYIECDSLGVARLKQIETLRGRKVKIKWKIKDNYIQVDCFKPSEEFLFKFKHKLIAILKDKYKASINSEVKHTKKELNWFQKIKLSITNMVLIFSIFVLAFLYYKKRPKKDVD